MTNTKMKNQTDSHAKAWVENGHEWGLVGDFGNHSTVCIRCGVVRCEDGKNKPCKGTPVVAPRTTDITIRGNND